MLPVRAWWRIALIGALALALALGTLALVWLFARPLAMLVFGIVLAQALSPLVAYLERWISRTTAVIVVYLALLLVLVGLGWIVIPALASQIQELVSRAPTLFNWAQNWIARGQELSGGRLINALENQLARIGEVLLGIPVAIFASAFEILLILFTSLYWLLATPDLKRFVLSLFPLQRRAQADDILNDMGQAMGGYVRGIVLDAVIVGVIAYVGFLFIGVDYPLVLALFGGLMEIIPTLGPIIAAIPAIGIAFLESPTQALIVLVFWIALQQFESYVLFPNVMRTQTDIPPLLVVLALFAGGSVGGLLRILIAVPLAGALRVFIQRVVAPAVRQWSGATEFKREASSNELP